MPAEPEQTGAAETRLPLWGALTRAPGIANADYSAPHRGRYSRLDGISATIFESFAEQNFPAIILERVDLPDGSFESREVLRFDWVWDETQGRAVIGFG